MSEEARSEHQAHDKCGHCHGQGHTECTSCHGAGEETCSTCHGKKDVTCSNCHGHGHYSNCNKCGSTGRVDCKRCGGSGQIRERCGNCRGSGKVSKERYRNCGKCHGEGVIHHSCSRWDRSANTYIHYDKPESCDKCNGTGQVKEQYHETCPTCGGDGRKSYTVNCPDCHGRGDFRCDRCHGTGKAECEKCSGTGKLTCSTCSGRGKVACHDCHGGGNHVCVHCYGTGETPPQVAPVISSGMDKVNEAVDLLNKKEYIKAFELFRETAIKHNNAAALRRLGRMYERGDAIYQNQKRANILYRIAANAGDKRALYCLGVNYVRGLGVDKNRSEARRLLELATAKGYAGAEEEYIKVADAKLGASAISGVVGWQKSFEIPKFLVEADPLADQKDKDEKEAARKAEAARIEAARKAEEERKAREKRWKARKISFCRGLWWLLFRIAAAGAFFPCFIDSYRDIPEGGANWLVALFFVCSYAIRPKFGVVGYFFIGLATPIIAIYIDASNPMASFPVFTVMVTFFMRWMGEYLKMPLLTYPMLGAMVGFLTSPYSMSHGVFRGEPWFFSCNGLAILFFLVNLGFSGNNGNGVVAQGERKPNWKKTFCLLGICGLMSVYFVASTGEVCRFRYTLDSEQKAEAKPSIEGLSAYEQGIRYRDGNGVERDVEVAKKKFAYAIDNPRSDDEVLAAEAALGKIFLDEGDFKRAISVLKPAAKNGSPEALLYLGVIQQQMNEFASAVKFYRVAADKGSIEAMLLLGRYYSEETGFFGGLRDRGRARKYFRMAADAGSEEAKGQLERLK